MLGDLGLDMFGMVIREVEILSRLLSMDNLRLA
jgi:hypothetical protein